MKWWTLSFTHVLTVSTAADPEASFPVFVHPHPSVIQSLKPYGEAWAAVTAMSDPL